MRTATATTAPASLPPRAWFGPVGDLQAGVASVRDDPVGVLLPSAGGLLTDVLAAIAVRSALGTGRWDVAVAGVIAAIAVRTVGQAVFRSRLLAVGARAAGIDVPPLGRPVAMLGVALLTGAPVALIGAAVLGPGIAVSAGIAAHGWYTTGALALAATFVAFTVATVAVRALFAYAPAEVVVGGASAARAMVKSAARAARSLPAVALIVAGGDLAVGIGALVCGACALPGYPVTDLAMLHRWRRRG